MNKVVVSMFVSADGVMEEPAWTFPYWNDEIAKFKSAEMAKTGALLLGRVTWEGFAEAWPGREDEEGYADKMNSMPKYVVSTTLRNPKWTNSHVISGDVVAEIKKLKAQDGEDLLVFGSATLVNFLIQHDLVDEYNLLVYPVVLGTGKRLFQDGSATALELAETYEVGRGVVAFRYRRAPGEAN
jgi:dihydrofolate reductase